MKTLCAEEVLTRAEARIKDPTVEPGTPARFTEACTPGDVIAQGDLNLKLVGAPPAGYGKVAAPTDADRQLVPGNTQGSKHILDSLEGVTLYRPSDWPNEESLKGPCFVLAEERTVLHLTHGAVTIPAGFTVLCTYQREWDKEEARQRRAQD